jgi:DNA-directed RNA polymerase specialized sigma24 family protein
VTRSIFYPWRPMKPPALPPDAGELLALHRGLFLWLAKRWYGWANPHRDRAVSIEDIASAFTLAALRRLHAYHPGRGTFASWLALEARNYACALRKKAMRLKRAAVCCSQFAGDDDFDRFAATADPKAAEPWEIVAEREED